MARQHQAKTAAEVATGIVLSVWLTAGAAVAQERPAAPVPFSRDCQVPNTSVISDLPLPNVASVLQKRKTLRILAIGASATGGRRGRGSYTDQIESILEKAVKGLDVDIINRGVSGELAAGAERRIKNEVALTEPDLVLWQVGTNDALAYVPIDELRDTIVGTIRWLKEHKVDVVLVGLQFVRRDRQDNNYRTVRELLRSIAREENVVIVRRSEAMQLLRQASGGAGVLPEDFSHTEAGYGCLAEYIARAIALGAFGRSLRDQPPRPGQSPPAGLPVQRP